MKVGNKQEHEKGFEFENAESRYQKCTSTKFIFSLFRIFDLKFIKGNLYYIIMPEFSLKHYWYRLINVSVLCNSVCSANE